MKENWKGISSGLLMITILILIVSFFGLNWWQTILVIVAFQIGMQLYMKFRKKRPFSFKQLLTGAAKVSGLVIMMTLLSRWALVGLLGVFIAFVAYRIITNFSTYKWGLEQVSKAMFGYSLFDKYDINKKNIIEAVFLLGTVGVLLYFTITDFSVKKLLMTIGVIVIIYWYVFGQGGKNNKKDRGQE